MSVQGEYSRALEAMLDRVRSLRHPRAEEWIQRLEAARIGSQPDLSEAARESLRILDAIRDDADAATIEGLSEPLSHLDAHCRAILGR